MTLRTTKIFRNLHYRFTIFGLGFEDIAICAVPGTLVLIGVVVFDISIMWSMLVTVATAIGLILLRHNRPPGYVEALVATALWPRRYSHKERDDRLRPFPLSPRQLAPGRFRKPS